VQIGDSPRRVSHPLDPIWCTYVGEADRDSDGPAAASSQRLAAALWARNRGALATLAAAAEDAQLVTRTSGEHPRRGDLYLVNTALLNGNDKKPRRPLVVISPPAFGMDSVPVLTCTTDLAQKGVAHAAAPELGLSKDGVFAYRFLRSMELRWFAVPGAAEPLGPLQATTFLEILAWWEGV
jgi:mRNA-degrading endonuclease toxin of MazEF toxin-antitoxin module